MIKPKAAPTWVPVPTETYSKAQPNVPPSMAPATMPIIPQKIAETILINHFPKNMSRFSYYTTSEKRLNGKRGYPKGTIKR
jgi:hypothetical protein